MDGGSQLWLSDGYHLHSYKNYSSGVGGKSAPLRGNYTRSPSVVQIRLLIHETKALSMASELTIRAHTYQKVVLRLSDAAK